jgi:hypothetical protein
MLSSIGMVSCTRPTTAISSRYRIGTPVFPQHPLNGFTVISQLCDLAEGHKSVSLAALCPGSQQGMDIAALTALSSLIAPLKLPNLGGDESTRFPSTNEDT